MESRWCACKRCQQGAEVWLHCQIVSNEHLCVMLWLENVKAIKIENFEGWSIKMFAKVE